MAILGIKQTTPETSESLLLGNQVPFAWRDVEDGQLYTMPEAGWVDGFGGIVSGSSEPQTWLRVAAWDASSGIPGAFIAQSSALGGVGLPVGFVHRFSPAQQHPLVMAGTRIALGGHLGNRAARVLYAESSPSITQMRRSASVGAFVTTAPDPFSAGGTHTEVGLTPPPSLYMEYTPNRPPNAPTDITVAGHSTPGQTLNTVAPVFTFKFSDPDQIAGYADKIQRYAIRVKDTDSGEVVWPLPGHEAAAQFAATTANQVPGATISRSYPGATVASTALQSGGNYSVEIQAQDLAGAWGAYSAPLTFSIAEIGSVSVADGSPSGKVDTVTDQIDFTGRWHHPDNAQTSHVQVRVLQNGAVWREGAEVAKVVNSASLPGSEFTITAAEAGIGELPRGQRFGYQIRAQASGIWTGYSTVREFSTNAPPNTPAPISPFDGATVAAPPVLTAISSDPDLDDIMGADVVWTIRLTRPDPLEQLIIQHPDDEMTYNGELSQVSYALDSTECPNLGTYVWEILADDLSASEEEEDYGKSEWSEPQEFTLEAGPQPTLTLPGSTVATVSPLYRFTVANGPHVRYRVVVYLAGTNTRVWDSQEVASDSLDVVQPAGYLKNAVSYDVQVQVWNGAGQSGTSNRRTFTVAFAAPDATSNVIVEPYLALRDPEPTALAISWDRTTLPANEFLGYVVRRRLASEPEDAAIILRTITNPAQTRWWDFHAPPGVALTYAVSQLRRGGSGAGTPVIEGPATEASATLDLNVIVVADALRPDTDRVVLRYLPVTLRNTPRQNVAPHTTWGSEGKPTMISAPGTQDVFQVTGTFPNDGTQRELSAALRALHKSQRIVSIRNRDERIFGKITQPSFQPGAQFEPDTVTFTVEETNYLEGQ